MGRRTITGKSLDQYKKILVQEEKAPATIDRYMHNITDFRRFADGQNIDKELVIAYKQFLQQRYAPRSVNAMLTSLNGFFKRMEWYDCMVKCLKIQNESFRGKGRELTKDEYYTLLATAERLGKDRLCLIMQTLCATGMRVSELRYVTVETVRNGYASVNLKGKVRNVLFPDGLIFLLGEYIKKKGIREGCVFVTRSGAPLDRSNINHEMKMLCKAAGVDPKKVFPHNLRHLFACVYYENEKNLNNLADILGHSNINTTRIYTQVSMEKLLRLMDGMGLVVVNPGKEKTDNASDGDKTA